MKAELLQIVLRATGASRAVRGEVIATLWSGYGEIVRLYLEGAAMDAVILKHVRFPDAVDHPRGWHSDLSHRRKVKSYEVEMAWYAGFANRCDEACRVPHCYAAQMLGEDHIMILEDLDAVGFPLRKSRLNRPEAEVCLKWLANFHAAFLGQSPDGLWPIGTYWHLDTRPDELAAVADTRLRQAAPLIDAALNSGQFKTLVHGDAKVANFCFSADGGSVAAVDFQYVGGGCGMKDVAYFIGSCLDACLCEAWEDELLALYFGELRRALIVSESAVDADAIEAEWRGLFPVAQADFHRFLAGWSPEHWKVSDYSKRITSAVVSQLSETVE